MKTKITQLILESKPLKRYMRFQKLSKYIKPFKWIAGLLFIIGAIYIIRDKEIPQLVKALFLIVWTPGLAFAFIGGHLHITAGMELHELSMRSGLPEKEIKELAEEILSKEQN
jgi:hypothetical protein